MKKELSLLSFLLILAGCSSSEGFTDINAWMKIEQKSVTRSIKEIPEAKIFQPVSFNAKNDPFKEKQIANLESLDKNKFAPDANRRKETLEKYSLDQLKITGMVIKDKQLYAIIKSPDGKNNYVTKGNYLGTNYGQIKNITENQIELEERVNDADDWKPKNTVLFFDQ